VQHTSVVEIIELESVPGFIVFDLPGVPFSAGGTRLAADVTRAEVALLARAMTYKFAALASRSVVPRRAWQPILPTAPSGLA
jgi:hypothetical protein